MLASFSELLSAETIPDSRERVAIETMFDSRVGTNLMDASFSGFVLSIYKQPDSIISEETKARIEVRFEIPRMPVKTGQELIEATLVRRPDGEFVHGSPEQALEFRLGLKAFVGALRS